MTLEEAKNLKHGQVLHHVSRKNADGTPQRWRVSGMVKTWKTRPDEIRVPVKYGLYGNDYITERTMHLLNLSEES